MVHRRARSRRTQPAEPDSEYRPPSFPVDVADRGEEYVVTVDVPGLTTRDIDVTVWKDSIEIVADFGDREEGRYHRRERDSGLVRRVIRLPGRVNEKRVTASYDDGVLWLTLRKRRPPRRVPVERSKRR